MSAVVGLLLVIVSIALFAWATIVFRNPNGPSWRDGLLVLEALVFVTVGCFIIGMALQIEYALQFPGALGLGLAIGAFALAAVVYFAVWRLFGVASKITHFGAAIPPPALKPKRA